MKRRLWLGWTAILFATLTGCGSSSTPPLTLSCTTHRLPGGSIRAAITVTNTTSASSRAIVFGPALNNLRHISPVLNPAQVVVSVGSTRQAFIGFLIPRVDPKTPAHLVMRFSIPVAPGAIVVTPKRTVHASNWQVLDNGDCTIKG